MVESQLPKLLVAGSIPVSRSKVSELRSRIYLARQLAVRNFRIRSDELSSRKKLLPWFSRPKISSTVSPAITTSSNDVSAQG